MENAHVVVIPYPAQGHVIPMMELAQRLVKHGVKVTIINTEVTQKLVTSTCAKEDGFSDLMQMVSIPDGLEPWEDRNDLGKLAEAMFRSMPGKLEELLESINKQYDSKVSCVIADDCMGWAIRVAEKMGIRRAAFWPASGFTLASMFSFQKLIDDGTIDSSYPAQGHVISIMELAQRLVNHGVKVTFINTELTHKLVTNAWSEKHSFGDLMHVVSIPDGLEPWDDRKDLGELAESISRSMPGKLEELIESINKEDNRKVSCVIADDCMGWAIQVAEKMGIRKASFWPASAVTLASMLSFQKLIDEGIINSCVRQL